jgi:ArsR family transcriptional regulator
MRHLANPQRHVLTTEQAAGFGEVLKVLAHPSRLLLLSLVARYGPVRPTDLQPHIALSQPTISHHLGLLYDAGFLVQDRKTREVLYSLAPNALEQVAAALVGEGR